MREVSELLSAWSGFYTMIGSSAAALTGLMFVVITLVTDERRGASEEGVSTFSTPTVVHFCGALFIAALMSMPFRSFVPIAVTLGLTGAAGSFFVVRIALRAWNLAKGDSTSYRPDAEDWTWHVFLPLVAYGALVASAVTLHVAAAQALFAPALAAILLIFIGIHNAWDVVTFLATGKANTPPDSAQAGGAEKKGD